MRTSTFDVPAGTHWDDAVEQAMAATVGQGHCIHFEFNGRWFTATAHDGVNEADVLPNPVLAVDPADRELRIVGTDVTVDEAAASVLLHWGADKLAGRVRSYGVPVSAVLYAAAWRLRDAAWVGQPWRAWATRVLDDAQAGRPLSSPEWSAK